MSVAFQTDDALCFFPHACFGLLQMMLLARTMAIMGFTLHWAACFYWMIVGLEGEVNSCGWEEDGADSYSCNTWHPPPYVKDQGMSMKYSYALFWGVSVTTGAGWDIVPSTELEVGGWVSEWLSE